MLILNKIVDVLLISGTLWVVWELGRAARSLAEPDATTKEILAATKQIQRLLGNGVRPEFHEKFDEKIEGGY